MAEIRFSTSGGYCRLQSRLRTAEQPLVNGGVNVGGQMGLRRAPRSSTGPTARLD